MKKLPKLKKVGSINELSYLANRDPRYLDLAIRSANNLGGNYKTLDEAINWLITNAMETDEEGVVGEINFCRDVV